MKRVELNITREQAMEFIDWLANDSYWGHTITDFELNHGEEEVEFVINNHTLSNYSNQHHQVIIDHCYCYAGGVGGCYVNDVCYTPLDYCLYRLGY